MRSEIPGVLIHETPAGAEAPVVFDSPHSGLGMPPEWRCLPGPEVMKGSGADNFIGDLFRETPQQGGTFVEALFHRAFVDANRDERDIDTAMLDGEWTGPLQPSERSRAGRGVVWRTSTPDIQLYDRRLGVAEVQERLRRYWQPYHEAVGGALDGLRARHGVVFLLDCHANRSRATKGAPEPPGTLRPEIELGTLHETTSGAAFVALLRDTLTRMGLQVVTDGHHAGEHIVRRYGRPAEGRHAVMMEIRKNLYMDEETLQPAAHWAEFHARMRQLSQAVCDFARAEAG